MPGRWLLPPILGANRMQKYMIFWNCGGLRNRKCITLIEICIICFPLKKPLPQRASQHSHVDSLVFDLKSWIGRNIFNQKRVQNTSFSEKGKAVFYIFILFMDNKKYDLVGLRSISCGCVYFCWNLKSMEAVAVEKKYKIIILYCYWASLSITLSFFLPYPFPLNAIR